MIYQAVGNRCAMSIKETEVSINGFRNILEALSIKGFESIEVDIVALAEDLVGKAEWKLPSRQVEAPHYFDCSSFTKWLYGQQGIRIPRRSIQQFEFCRNHGGEIHRDETLQPGDLLFVTSPFVGGIYTNENDGIGHVCLVVEQGNIICATNSEFGSGVVKLPLHHIFRTRNFCGAGRVVPKNSKVVTLVTPPHREIETSDDVYWILKRSTSYIERSANRPPSAL